MSNIHKFRLHAMDAAGALAKAQLSDFATALERLKTSRATQYLKAAIESSKINNKQHEEIIELLKLKELCREFIDENRVSCGESACQSDDVEAEAPVLVAAIGELIGFYKDE